MLQILGGQFRSRRLKTPHNQKVTRPWTGRARESIFNQLRGHLVDSNVLDLFAGVGTMGLEALSRGATHVVLVEQEYKIFKLLEGNIENLQCEERAFPIQTDALSSIPLLRAQRPLDIAFIDPPYAMMTSEQSRIRVLEQAAHIGPLLHKEGLVILRTPIDPTQTNHDVEGLAGPEIQKLGTGMWILFYGKRNSG